MLLCWTNFVDVVLLAERVEDDVDLVEHVHHLHRRDVDADLIKLDHVAKQDGHIWKNLGTEKLNTLNSQKKVTVKITVSI